MSAAFPFIDENPPNQKAFGSIFTPEGKDYKWYISGIFPANWGIIICHLPTFLREPKNNHSKNPAWFSPCPTWRTVDLSVSFPSDGSLAYQKTGLTESMMDLFAIGYVDVYGICIYIYIDICSVKKYTYIDVQYALYSTVYYVHNLITSVEIDCPSHHKQKWRWSSSYNTGAY